MTSDEKKLILEYAELGLKLLPRGGQPPAISAEEKERMAEIRDELAMEHAVILARAAQMLMGS